MKNLFTWIFPIAFWAILAASFHTPQIFKKQVYRQQQNFVDILLNTQKFDLVWYFNLERIQNHPRIPGWLVLRLSFGGKKFRGHLAIILEYKLTFKNHILFKLIIKFGISILLNNILFPEKFI